MADTAGEKFAFVNIQALSIQQLAEYRQELVNAILYPGSEYELQDPPAEAAYRTRLGEVDARLKELTGSPEGGNL